MLAKLSLNSLYYSLKFAKNGKKSLVENRSLNPSLARGAS
jgi:hypothetical protein